MVEKPRGYFKVTLKEESGWQWEVISEMGQTIAVSHHVPERDAALKTLKWLRTNIDKCPIVDTEGKPIT
jgi:hypothetical protein